MLFRSNVYACDEKGPGGANHEYKIHIGNIGGGKDYSIKSIQFQKGPRKVDTSISGIIDTDLLEIVRDRLIAFQRGPFASRENAMALTHIEESLMWLNRRVEDRIERDVLRTDQI